jgi:hypothetical protein
MNQDVGEGVKRSEQWGTQRVIGARTQGGNDVGGRRLGATPRQLVDRTSHARAPESRPHEYPKTVGEDADDVCGHGLDVPARAQAWGRQLGIVQVLYEGCDLAPLVGDSGEDKVALHSHRVTLLRNRDLFQ